MPRRPGRDQGLAARRHLQLLTRLAQAAPGWVNRDMLMNELSYGDKSRRDQIARDIKLLRERGWAIEKRGEGDDMAHRLVDQDPRLRTMLDDEQLGQLVRAVVDAGRDPRSLNLPDAHLRPAAGAAPIDHQLNVALGVEEALHALTHRCLLTIDYRGKVRDIHIDGVRRTGTGRWRIVAREDGVQKVFRIDRIDGLQVGAPGTASPTEPVAKDPDPLTIADGDPITAEVITTDEHETRVIRDLGTPSRRSERDGEIALEIPVVNRWLWRQRLYQLGTRVRLVGPAALRDEIRSDLLSFVAGDS